MKQFKLIKLGAKYNESQLWFFKELKKERKLNMWTLLTDLYGEFLSHETKC